MKLKPRIQIPVADRSRDTYKVPPFSDFDIKLRNIDESELGKADQLAGHKRALRDIQNRPYEDLREIAASLEEQLKVASEDVEADEDPHSIIRTQARIDELKKYLVGDIELEQERAKFYKAPVEVVKSEQPTSKKWWKMPAVALGAAGAAVVAWFGFKGVDEEIIKPANELQTENDVAVVPKVKEAAATPLVEQSQELASYSIKAGDTVDEILHNLILASGEPVSDKLAIRAYQQILKDNNLQEQVVGDKIIVKIKIGDTLLLKGAEDILHGAIPAAKTERVASVTEKKTPVLYLPDGNEELTLTPTETWDLPTPEVLNTTLVPENNLAVTGQLGHNSEVRDLQRLETNNGMTKLIHDKLRAQGLNWRSDRMNFLMQLAVNDSVDELRGLFASGAMKKWKISSIPEGAEKGAMIDFTTVDKVIDQWKKERETFGKSRSIAETAKAMGMTWNGKLELPE